jgi:hypothetical protein
MSSDVWMKTALVLPPNGSIVRVQTVVETVCCFDHVNGEPYWYEHSTGRRINPTYWQPATWDRPVSWGELAPEKRVDTDT